MKNIFKIILVLFLATFIVSCAEKNSTKTENTTWSSTIVENKKIKVVWSINPITSIVNYIWDTEVEAENIVPAWVSPHHFELTPQNLVSLEKAEIVFSIWLEHIDWFLDKNENKNKVKLADWIELLEATEHSHEEEHDDHHDEEKENHSEEETHDKDPHIWLSEKNLKIISEKIANKLSEIKPEKKEIFQKNKEKFDEEIKNIFENFRKENKGKNPNEFIVFHDAYNYLLQSLEISENKKIVFSENVSAEIDANHLKELLDEIKKHNIKIIFKEPQFNSSQIENLALENNLKIFILDPIWADSSKNWFINNLKKNLENLKNIY